MNGLLKAPDIPCFVVGGLLAIVTQKKDSSLSYAQS